MSLKKILILFSTLFFVKNLVLANQPSELSKFEKIGYIESLIIKTNNNEVFVCNGSYSIAYHSRSNCSGMNNCKSSITSVTESYAETVLNRRPCCICWNTNGGCKTDESEYLIRSLNLKPPLINNPNTQLNSIDARIIVGMYLQKKYDARRDWIQERITGLVDLINILFTKERIPKCISCQFNSIRENRVKDISDYAKSIAAADFANDYSFSTIQNSFNTLESSVYGAYNFFLHNDPK